MTDFSNASLSVTLGQGKPGDQLSIAASNYHGLTLEREKKSLTIGGLVVGTVTGGKHKQPLTVQFQPGAENLVINQVLEHVTLKTKRAHPGTRTVTTALKPGDGQQLANLGGSNIDVQPNP